MSADRPVPLHAVALLRNGRSLLRHSPLFSGARISSAIHPSSCAIATPPPWLFAPFSRNERPYGLVGQSEGDPAAGGREAPRGYGVLLPDGHGKVRARFELLR